MKYLIAFIVLFALPVFASDPVCSESQSEEQITDQLLISTDVPNYLKGATITVRLADGRETTVPAERFKVVPRKQQYLTTKTERSTVVSCVSNEPRKNRVALLGGYGARPGLGDIKQNGPALEVESNVGAVGGAQYQRMLDDRFSLGVQGQTNKTGSLMLGIDF